MLRAAALSFLILVSVAATLPLVDTSAHYTGRAAHSRRYSRVKRRHSKAWWRRYRARLRRQRAAQQRLRELRAQRAQARQSLNAKAESHNTAAPTIKIVRVNPSSTSGSPASAPAKMSENAPKLTLPNGWSRRGVSANGEVKYQLARDGRYVAEAVLAPVKAQPAGDVFMSSRGQRKHLGGVAFSELRRTVIDRMIVANGWVVNDMSREIAGKPVFIVIAQTAGDGRDGKQTWVFFFTEVDGRIYSLTSKASAELSERMVDDSAQLLATFHANHRAVAAGPSQR